MTSSSAFFVCRVVGAFLLLVGALSVAQENSTPRLLPFPEVRLGPNGEGAEGKLWLSWGESDRLGFSRGFIQGYGTGWGKACSQAAQIATTEANVYLQCVGARGDILGTAESYRDLATAFYTSYPKDQALPINRLFLKLLERGMTIQQVHHWLDGLTTAADEKYRGK